MTYLECRYMYCREYQRLVVQESEFSTLRKMIEQEGCNVQLIGYDAYDVGQKTPYECYLDTSRPFGHELVLYTLLVESDPEQYPWNRYRRENPQVYAFLEE